MQCLGILKKRAVGASRVCAGLEDADSHASVEGGRIGGDVSANANLYM